MKRRLAVIVCIALAIFYAGCTGDKGKNDVIDLRLNLSTPDIFEREVVVNGGIMAPVERIQWDWGDGQIEKHHFFPHSHTYNKPGRYQITVTVFDSKNRTATQSVTVDIS
ncbi:MAG: PKD domain-containing protein [Deltaproteobacteria bacterium]|nr:PKD domain-containing protein [Deltaproteobacteria bacterium]